MNKCQLLTKTLASPPWKRSSISERNRNLSPLYDVQIVSDAEGDVCTVGTSCVLWNQDGLSMKLSNDLHKVVGLRVTGDLLRLGHES
jgi:hypothetical protein